MVLNTGQKNLKWWEAGKSQPAARESPKDHKLVFCFFKLAQKNTNCWKEIWHSIFQIIFLKKQKYSLSYLFNYFESAHTTEPLDEFVLSHS